MLEDLARDDEADGARLAEFLEGLLEAGGVDVVGDAFELDQPFGQLVDARAVARQVAQQRHDFGRDRGRLPR